jgi:hypothetical protein
MSATSTPDYFVRYVQIMDEAKEVSLIINETEEDGGYGDYKSQTIDLVAGEKYQAMIRGKLYGTAQTYWKILIDIDKNGAFDGLNETILSKDGDGWAYHLFIVPSDIASGSYIFRVVMSSSPLINLCGSFIGEFEDYTANITNNSLSAEDDFGYANKVSIYPNPTTGRVNLNAEGEQKVVSVQIINTQSQIVFSADGNFDEIDISNQKSGMYFVEINFERGFSKVLKLIKR